MNEYELPPNFVPGCLPRTPRDATPQQARKFLDALGLPMAAGDDGAVVQVYQSMLPPVYDDSCPIYEQALWTPQTERFWLEGAEPYDYNQNPDPSCSFFSAANDIMFWAMLCNREMPELDPRKAWIECTGGRGGYAIDGTMAYLKTKGMPTKDGKRIILTEAWDCPNAKAAFSAVKAGMLVHFGWHHPVGPHAEAFVFVKDQNTAKIRNSWGKQQQCWHDVSYSSIASGIQTFGAWALRDFEIRKDELDGLVDAKG